MRLEEKCGGAEREDLREVVLRRLGVSRAAPGRDCGCAEAARVSGSGEGISARGGELHGLGGACRADARTASVGEA